MPKIILVTGSNAGIGYELVRLLAEQGHIVYLSSRDEAKGKEAIATLHKDGLSVKFVQLDVTSPESIAAAKSFIEQHEGRLDVLVNNAGLNEYSKAVTANVDIFRRVFEPNFFGVIQTTTEFITLLRKSPQPVIINVSSELSSNTLQSRHPFTHGVVAYSASKAALNSYTIALAHELRDEGFKVIAVTPGLTSTKLTRGMGKSAREGAELILPWVLVGTDGPTGVFMGTDGNQHTW